MTSSPTTCSLLLKAMCNTFAHVFLKHFLIIYTRMKQRIGQKIIALPYYGYGIHIPHKSCSSCRLQEAFHGQ
jgi:hypothetical protein